MSRVSSDVSPFSLKHPYEIRSLPSVDKNQIVMKKRQRKSVSQLPKTRLTAATLMKNAKVKLCKIFSNVFIVPFYNNKPRFEPDFVTDHIVLLHLD